MFKITTVPEATLGDLRAFRKWQRHPGYGDMVLQVYSDKKEALTTAAYCVKHLGCPVNLIVERSSPLC